MNRWRWLDTGDADGPVNMAIDEAILTLYQQRRIVPTIRVYRWRPPCVSLGYFQRFIEVNAPLCRERGIDIVRRVTGGRALLHDDEVTYSVVVDEETLDTRGVIESFRRISQGIIEGLRLLGIQSELKATTVRMPGRTPSPSACFGSAARCDLVSNGRKIVGSAQVRRAGAILQHGAIPLTFDFEAARELLNGDDLNERVTDVRSLTKESALSSAELSLALFQGFRSIIDGDLQPDALTDDERQLAFELARTKYANEGWTQRR